MKDRLEYPLEFLESMRFNFLGNVEWQVKSLVLIDTLTDAIKGGSPQHIQKWIESFDSDPELFGSAFLQVYRFAVDYFNKTSGTLHPLSRLWQEA